MNHIGLSVSDLDRAIGFYRDLLGMSFVGRDTFGGEKYETIMGLNDAKGKVALLRLGNLQIEMFEFESPSVKVSDRVRPVCDHGISHFCLEVTDIHAEHARLAAAGVIFHCAPLSFSGNAIATYGRDPDGNVFELLEVTHSS
jgi:catechol 2,3-dioxygenase-like lactoylglutathione lyase family enzyme